ncbi:MAG TPA: hypothetical protein VF652_07700 [Allosphingosinicella sp.]
MAWKANGTVPRLAMAMGVLAAGAVLATGVAEAKPAKKQDPSKRVCQTITPSGSRLSQRVCRTRQEIEDQARETQDSLLDHQRKNTATNPLTDFHAGSPK